ncbi:MAG: hypothetical protein CL916_01440 [Deltaproteobacteria bacterium]|nr:hypothetical protein [Deltaproteobacteria bacterium]
MSKSNPINEVVKSKIYKSVILHDLSHNFKDYNQAMVHQDHIVCDATVLNYICSRIGKAKSEIKKEHK